MMNKGDKIIVIGGTYKGLISYVCDIRIWKHVGDSYLIPYESTGIKLWIPGELLVNYNEWHRNRLLEELLNG